MADALVEFDSVVKRFGDFTAVETMNFTIDEGEFIAIMGALPCKGQVKAGGRIGGCRPKKQLEEAAVKKRKQISPKRTLNKTTQAHHVHGEVEIRGHNLL